MPLAFFQTTDGEWFTPNEIARGPWDPDACHAGPPTGLLARASEQVVPTQPLVRLTVDLVRPVPFSGFGILAEITRAGRSVSTTRMTLIDGAERPVLTATGMHIADAITPEAVPTTPYQQPILDESVIGPFPALTTAHGQTWFADGVEVRYPPNEPTGPGPKRMWMKAAPLLEDEEPSGFQRVCPLADCGNAVSRNGEASDGFRFINPDLTIVMHRAPVGEWIGTDSVSRWEPSGRGLSDSLLFDTEGAIGRAIQTLIVEVGEPIDA